MPTYDDISAKESGDMPFGLVFQDAGGECQGCGNYTKWYDIDYRSYICSTECMRTYNIAIKAILDAEKQSYEPEA